MHPAIQRIGLTGGIGSGKSSVARTLADCGAAVIDADAISRQLTAAGGSAIRSIADQFGEHLINARGAMDRDLMRQLAFNDPAVKQQLEAIIHPLVRAETLRQAERAIASACTCIVFDIPLLVESGRWRKQLDQVLVVDCSEAIQVARVTAREVGSKGWTPQAVEKVIAGQATRAQRLAAADICIYNEGLSLDALALLVRQLAGRFGL